MRVNEGLVDPRVEPWASMVLIAPNHIESGTSRLLSLESAKKQGADSGKYMVRAGQIVYSKIRPALNKVTIAPHDCLCSADMYPISGNPSVADHRFVVYWMLARPFVTFASLTSDRVKMPKINREELGGAPWIRPPIEEQRRIADFLDRETAQIDALIAKQEKLIETLRKRRTIVADQALENPGHKVVKKLAWAFTFHNGDRGASYPSREEFTNSGIPFINAGHLTGWSIDFSSMNYVTEEKFASMGGAKLRRNDILFCLRGSLGKIGLFEENGTGALASSLVALRRVSDDMDVRYSMYLLNSRRTQDAIGLVQTGSAQPNLSVDQLGQFRYFVPAIEEQRKTVAYLDDRTARIDALIAKALEFVGLARERRAALITEAVTGRIDVSTGKLREGA